MNTFSGGRRLTVMGTNINIIDHPKMFIWTNFVKSNLTVSFIGHFFLFVIKKDLYIVIQLFHITNLHNIMFCINLKGFLEIDL